MKKNLKVLRVSVALIVLLLFLLSFSILSDDIGGLTGILHFQFVPSFIAFMGGGTLIFLFFMVLTLVFGRVYCSFLCPLGILQDVISRMAGWFKTKKQKRTRYTPAHSLLRLVILFAVTVTVIVGSLSLLVALDPYSNFGRMATQLFLPLERLVSNLLSHIFPDYFFYAVPRKIVLGSFLWALGFFLIVAVMSAFRGRLFCNTLCPVGTVLGYLSNISLFRLTIDREKCIGCHSCEKHCKAECIDSGHQTIDASRCVMCLNCLEHCSSDAIRYRFRYASKRSSEQPPSQAEMQGRREAVAAIGAVVAMLAARSWNGKHAGKNAGQAEETRGIVPPGGVGVGHLKNHCTACHACIQACPSHIIHPALGEYGLNGLFLPVLHYEDKFCSFDCHACSEICPEGALLPISLEKKRKTAIGKAVYLRENCIVVKDGTACGACAAQCPTHAIAMVKGTGKLAFPQIDTARCIGCGGCQYICPGKAMEVRPLAEHETLG